MHSTETRNQFLKLRVQGLSFNRIASQIGVSKPTLIAWSRKRHAEIQSQRTSVNLTRDEALKLSHKQAVDHLNIKIKSIQQELVSRSLRHISTEQLESVVNQMQQKLQNLEAVNKSALYPVAPQARSNPIKPDQTKKHFEAFTR